MKNSVEPVVVPPSSDLAFEDNILQLDLLDPDLPVRVDAWPSSDIEAPEDVQVESASLIPDNWTDCGPQSDDSEDEFWVKGLGFDMDVFLEDRDRMLVDKMDDGAMETNSVTGPHSISKEHGIEADFNSPKIMITS